MEKTYISDIIGILEDLGSGLDEAYWQAHSLETKDLFYDLVSAVNGELFELAKLSVQDHDLEYEPITTHFRVARGKLSQVRKNMGECVFRTPVAIRLEKLITELLGVTPH